jgi:hypothetical protein
VSTWANHDTVKERWLGFISPNGSKRKSFPSLVMLVSWEIWNERKARVFRNFASMPSCVVSRIKSEVGLSSVAGVKHLCGFRAWLGL